MTTPYLPSSGSEGEWFFGNWCQKCARDKAMSEGKNYDDCAPEETCQIIARSFVGQVDEWVEDDNGPRCTAFVPVGTAVPEPRCTQTADMFGID